MNNIKNIPYTLTEKEIKDFPEKLRLLARKVKICYSPFPYSTLSLNEINPIIWVSSVRLKLVKKAEKEDLLYWKTVNRKTVFHELGHFMERRLTREIFNEWLIIHKIKPKMLSLSQLEYNEDFAQSFMFYHLEKELLKELESERFNFMEKLHKKEK